jgi:hypothetical protein
MYQICDWCGVIHDPRIFSSRETINGRKLCLTPVPPAEMLNAKFRWKVKCMHPNDEGGREMVSQPEIGEGPGVDIMRIRVLRGTRREKELVVQMTVLADEGTVVRIMVDGVWVVSATVPPNDRFLMLRKLGALIEEAIHLILLGTGAKMSKERGADPMFG